MILFFAGAEAYKEMLIANGGRNGLASYFHLTNSAKSGPENWRDIPFDRFLLDSGGFTARTKGQPIAVSALAGFVRATGVRVIFNLDTNDWGETLRNQEYLERETDSYVIPIFHPQEWRTKEGRKEFDRWLDRYPLVAAGGIAGKCAPWSVKQPFLDWIFARTKGDVAVHGLGVSAKLYIRRWPFYSVDSTSYLSPQKYGAVGTATRPVDKFRNRAARGHWTVRTGNEIRRWLKIEEETTDLWRARGITWADPDLGRKT